MTVNHFVDETPNRGNPGAGRMPYFGTRERGANPKIGEGAMK